MGGIYVRWDDEHDPKGNVQKIRDHGLTTDDVEFVLNHPVDHGVSRSSGRPAVFGWTPAGTYIFVVYEEIDEETVYPFTAYEIEE